MEKISDTPQIYREYIQDRRAERLTGEVNGRMNVKADIARSVTEGDLVGSWYLNHLEKPVLGSTFGEVARHISDGNAIPGRREPSLAESVMATQERNKEYEKIKDILLPKSVCLIKVGSTGWAENFDVRSGDDPSDLDLEVMVDDVKDDLLEEFPGGKEGMELFKHYYDQGLVDYFSFSYKQDNVPVSIHIMPKKFFEKNCKRDYENLTNNKLAREFRVIPKSKAPVYNERYNAKGKEYIFTAEPELLPEGGQVTGTPIMMVGDEGELVMGLVMSKYFTYPPVKGDAEFFEDCIDQFKTSVAERLEKEGGKFSELPARKDRMPYYIKDQLDLEQQRILLVTKFGSKK